MSQIELSWIHSLARIFVETTGENEFVLSQVESNWVKLSPLGAIILVKATGEIDFGLSWVKSS